MKRNTLVRFDYDNMPLEYHKDYCGELPKSKESSSSQEKNLNNIQ